ncbi:MAG: hypothetical protein WDN44_02070 [Sphingomonas sp.]
MPTRIWVDTRFRSAFLLATRGFARGSVSARIEAFGTARPVAACSTGEYSEDGWALAAAARARAGAAFQPARRVPPRRQPQGCARRPGPGAAPGRQPAPTGNSRIHL